MPRKRSTNCEGNVGAFHSLWRVVTPVACRRTGGGVGRRDNSKVDDDVEVSPLLAMFQMEERRHRQSGGAGTTVKKEVPHLSFEITSDDGFRVESDSLTSKSLISVS